MREYSTLGGDLIVGFAMDDAIAGKLFELFGESGVGDVELAEEFVEAQGAVF